MFPKSYRNSTFHILAHDSNSDCLSSTHISGKACKHMHRWGRLWPPVVTFGFSKSNRNAASSQLKNQTISHRLPRINMYSLEPSWDPESMSDTGYFALIYWQKYQTLSDGGALRTWPGGQWAAKQIENVKNYLLCRQTEYHAENFYSFPNVLPG